MKRIIFMGTPEFAVEPLVQLNKSNNISVELVITGKDKRRSRNILQPTPVKSKAIEIGIDTYEPDNVNSKESIEKINKINPDFIVVIAYGQIIKDELLKTYKDRIINIHSSLLPKYRGPAPMQWTILNRDKVAGVTSMLIEKSMDTGDILDTRKIQIDEDTDIETLHDELTKISGELIVNTISNYEYLYNNRREQDETKASYSKKIDKEMGHLDFNEYAENIKAKILAFASWPQTYVLYKGKKLKIHKISTIERYNNYENGYIIKSDFNGIYVNCIDKCILIEEIQFEGKKRMNVKSYLLGNTIESGTLLK